ncbi:MAG: hypothetical protein GWP68_07250 [Verrucomicrobiaceae bacterium]|nr:hypothetical protein [Verrucomicrobiaceae bacterium]
MERASGEREFVLIDVTCQYDDYEAKWWSECHITREQVLDAMIEDGWQPLENDSDWDCQRGEVRAIIAVEDFASGSQVLTRLEMNTRNRGSLPTDFTNRLESLSLVRAK